ncbi:hypothetical protein R3W88_007688 [Solanum pinnatisectum]|uniref:Uncharacterized protein n=1 Tax=Solanum pinnatisectum TaxID=50273 RepID=A0AAV9M7S5_9SOLN|nr:hypothetical protein R3W88_007688 [Solanum pinnatisectum]
MREKARTAWIDPLVFVLDVAPSRSHKDDWARQAGLKGFGEGRRGCFFVDSAVRLLL